jgi:hypothetical protein
MGSRTKFEVGTQFVGNVNRAALEVVSIEQRPLMTESGRIRHTSPRVIVKNLKTGRQTTVGLALLEHCDVTILRK